MKKTMFSFALGLAFAASSVQAQSPQKPTFETLYLQQAEKNAAAETRATLAVLSKKYKLNKDTYKTLYQVYFNRRMEIEKALMSDDKTLKSGQKLSAILVKHDSISNVYLTALKNKSLVGNKIMKADDNSKFASAVRDRGYLKLEKTQVDSLMHQSQRMTELKKENPELDLKAYERKHLPTILTDEQYTNLLIRLNRKRAYDWSAGSWKSLKERGINQDLDSSKVVTELFNHNLAKLVKYERFGNEAPKASPSLQKITTDQPEALKRLQFDKARNTAKKSVEAKTNFAW